LGTLASSFETNHICFSNNPTSSKKSKQPLWTMDEANSVDDLIQQLDQLYLEEATALAQLNQRKANLLAQLQQARNRVPIQPVVSPIPPLVIPGNQEDFYAGCHVAITNRKNPRHTAAAVVTDVTEERVYIITDNGSKTWRARRDLRRL
jgi:hypothetical protein